MVAIVNDPDLPTIVTTDAPDAAALARTLASQAVVAGRIGYFASDSA